MEGGPCHACQATVTKSSSWYGNAEFKYCHHRGCRRAGEEAGHIIKRAAKKQKLAGIDGRIFDSTHMAVIEADYIAATRFFAAGALDGEVASRNEVPEEERALQMLVYGRFLLDESDKKGKWAHFWMDPEDLLSAEHVDAESVTAMRRAYRAEEDRLWDLVEQ